jgi:hypothetical protein
MLAGDIFADIDRVTTLYQVGKEITVNDIPVCGANDFGWLWKTR